MRFVCLMRCWNLWFRSIELAFIPRGISLQILWCGLLDIWKGFTIFELWSHTVKHRYLHFLKLSFWPLIHEYKSFAILLIFSFFHSNIVCTYFWANCSTINQFFQHSQQDQLEFDAVFSHCSIWRATIDIGFSSRRSISY